jgi:enoyl-CoA hydratase/carnithine racemase
VAEPQAGRPPEAADEPVLLARDAEHVRVLTLNRPAKLNAFNAALFSGLADALTAAAADDDVRVVVLTGAGRAFSAGADLTDMTQDRDVRNVPADRMLQAAESFPKPLVAAVNGVGVGVGFTILGHCDFAFVARSARLRTPFIQLGIAPEAASTFQFPMRMGWSNAARALLAGEWFDAQRVVEAGLAQEVCDDDAVLATAVAYATQVAAGSREALMATKTLMLDAHRDMVAQARQRETEAGARLRGTAAHQAALRDFHSR